MANIDLKDVAFQKALNLLNTLGARYKISYNDTTYSTFDEKPEEIVHQRRLHRARSGIDYKAIYKPAIEKAIAENEPMFTIEVPADMEIEKLRGALTAHMTQRFGAGTTATQVNKAGRSIFVLLE